MENFHDGGVLVVLLLVFLDVPYTDSFVALAGCQHCVEFGVPGQAVALLGVTDQLRDHLGFLLVQVGQDYLAVCMGGCYDGWVGVAGPSSVDLAPKALPARYFNLGAMHPQKCLI